MGASQLLENISDMHREHWGQTDENETNQSKIKQRKHDITQNKTTDKKCIIKVKVSIRFKKGCQIL